MKQITGVFKKDFSLARLTSWHVGGPAYQYFRPADLEDLSLYLKHYHDQSDLFWLGLGSNLLIRDGGVEQTVIHTLNRLNALEMQQDLVYVQAGVPCAKFAKWCMRAGLSGAEFLAGIPGTMGGALRMNAGAYGGETWDLVKQVQLISPTGEVFWLNVSDFAIGYRSVKGFDEHRFVGALLKLSHSTATDIAEYTKNMLQKRNAAQPIGTFNCGSVFRNPEGHYAGKLIAEQGLKGLQVGGASVSQKHANFIINEGSATAYDIECLISKVQDIIAEKTGYHLYRECHIMGNYAYGQQQLVTE